MRRYTDLLRVRLSYFFPEVVTPQRDDAPVFLFRAEEDLYP
jgi:hypothetical protein